MYCIIKCKKTNVKQIKFFYIANKIVILTIILIKKTTVYCNLKCNRTRKGKVFNSLETLSFLDSMAI